MRLFVSVLTITLAAASAETPEISVASIMWKDVFGYCTAQPHTTFSLMALGARGPTARKNVQPVIEEWLKKHPNAHLITVCRVRDAAIDSEALLTFVWVVDGDENLNLELVRQGCLPLGTQMVPDKNALQVPKADYFAFTKKGIVAGAYAMEHKLGLYSEDTSNHALQPTAGRSDE